MHCFLFFRNCVNVKTRKVMYKNEIKKYSIDEYKLMTLDFISKNQKNLDWNKVSIYCQLSNDFIFRFRYKLNIDLISKYQSLSSEFLQNYPYLLNWKVGLFYQKEINYDNIWNYFVFLNLKGFLHKKEITTIEFFLLRVNFPEEFLQNFIDKFKFYLNYNFKPLFKNLYKHQKLSEKIIIRNKNILDWNYITKYQYITFEFLDDIYIYIDWKVFTLKYFCSNLYYNFLPDDIFYLSITKYMNYIQWKDIIKFVTFLPEKYIIGNSQEMKMFKQTQPYYFSIYLYRYKLLIKLQKYITHYLYKPLNGPMYLNIKKKYIINEIIYNI